jgi:hypothetical protein
MAAIVGRIVIKDGSGAAGMEVRAFDQDLPSKLEKARQRLGSPVLTDPSGGYKIEYSEEQYFDGEAQSQRPEAVLARDAAARVSHPDIVVVAVNPGTGKTIESRIHFNAGSDEQIEDLILDEQPLPGISEFERILLAIKPVITDIPIIDLTAQDIAFLEGETGWSGTYLDFFVRAAQFQRKTDLASEAFYALMRVGLPAELPELVDQHISIHRRAFDTAVESKEPIIASVLTERIPDWTRRLQALRLNVLSEGGDAKTSTGAWVRATVFESAGTDEDVRRKRDAFLRKWVEHDGDTRSFWNGLRADELLRADVGKLQVSFQLGILTQHNIALTRAVQEKHRPPALRDLVRLSEADWLSLLKESNASIPPDTAGSTAEVQRRVYAATLVGLLQLALPVEATAHALANINPTHFGESHTRDGVVRFLWNVSGDDLKRQDIVFDLATSHITQFVGTHKEKVYEGIAEENRPKVLEGVKRVQRLYRISTRPETLAALLEMPHGSAYEIARFSKKNFVDQYMDRLGGGEEAALIHDRAVAESSTRLALAIQMYQHVTDAVPAFIGGKK